MINVELLQILVDNGFLHVKDLGTIAQLSRETNNVATDERVWETLCLREFPFIQRFRNNGDEGNGSYRDFYMRCSTPAAKRPRHLVPPLDPPRFTADQLQLGITIKYKGKRLFQEVSGEAMQGLLRDGGFVVDFNEPIALDKAMWDFGEHEQARGPLLYYPRTKHFQGIGVKCRNFCPRDLQTDIVVLGNVLDGTVRSLYTSKDRHAKNRGAFPLFAHPLVEEGQEVKRDTLFNQSNTKFSGLFYVAPITQKLEHWPLRDTVQAAKIKNRFPHPVGLGIEFEFQVFEDNFCIKALRVWSIAGSIVLAASNVQRFTILENAYGVSLLHIFSELA